MVKKNIELVNSLWWSTLLAGFCIYIFFRSNNLIYNIFFSFPVKLNVQNNSFFTDFLVYSLPNGLWSLSYSQLIFHIYKDIRFKIVLLSSLMFFFGILIEVFQFQGFIAGHFDIIDIFTYVIFHSLILVIQK